MEIVSFLQIYISFWSNIIQEFFPNLLTYKQLALVMAFISSLSIMYRIIRLDNGKLEKNFIKIFGFLFVLIILYLITGQNAHYNNSLYQSMRLVIVGQVAPAMLTACLVSNNDKIEYKIKKTTPIIAILFTLVSYTSIIHPSSTTSGGAMLDDNGLNYQSASYMSAYAFGLSAFYILCFDKVEWYPLFRSKFVRIAYIVVLFLNFIGVLLAGGRGATVLIFIEVLVLGVAYLKEHRVSTSDLLRNMFLTIMAVSGFVLGIKYAANSNLETSGFNRIINSLTIHDSSGRDSIYQEAWDSFKKNPFGYGVGSVFGVIGFYSHNLFFDSLVEIGALGTIVLIVVLFKALNNSIKLIKIDFSNLIWLIFFLHGMIMALFSGYYLCNQALCWSVAFLLTRKVSLDNYNNSNFSKLTC